MFKKALATALVKTMMEKNAVIPVAPLLKGLAKKTIGAVGKRIPKVVWKGGKYIIKHPFQAMAAGAGLKGVKSFMGYPYA